MKEIERLRGILNKKIENGTPIQSLLPLSQELDKLIVKFMNPNNYNVDKNSKLFTK